MDELRAFALETASHEPERLPQQAKYELREPAMAFFSRLKDYVRCAPGPPDPKDPPESGSATGARAFSHAARGPGMPSGAPFRSLRGIGRLAGNGAVASMRRLRHGLVGLSGQLCQISEGRQESSTQNRSLSSVGLAMKSTIRCQAKGSRVGSIYVL